MIINPALAGFIDALVDLVLKDLLEHPPVTDSTESTKHSHTTEHENLEYEVLTVDEAVARFGVTTAEVMAAFEGSSKAMPSVRRPASR